MTFSRPRRQSGDGEVHAARVPARRRTFSCSCFRWSYGAESKRGQFRRASETEARLIRRHFAVRAIYSHCRRTLMGLLSPEIDPGTFLGSFPGYPGAWRLVKTSPEVFLFRCSSLKRNPRENISLARCAQGGIENLRRGICPALRHDRRRTNSGLDEVHAFAGGAV